MNVTAILWRGFIRDPKEEGKQLLGRSKLSIIYMLSSDPLVSIAASFLLQKGLLCTYTG